MRLFWCEKTRAQRVAWMMEELGQPYERVRIDIRDEASKNDDDFRAASPMGKVPALEDGPVKLWDSGAICLYLADKYPGAGLTVPVNDPQRGAFLQWIMFTNAVIEPAMGEKFAGSDPDRLRHGWGSFEQMIDVLGRGLAKGPWLLGNALRQRTFLSVQACTS